MLGGSGFGLAKERVRDFEGGFHGLAGVSPIYGRTGGKKIRCLPIESGGGKWG